MARWNSSPAKSSQRSRRRRGVATAEAVVALPVLVLLFAGIFFFRDRASAQHETATRARTCAWLYSAGDCRAIPAGCEGVLTDTSAVGDASEIPLPGISGDSEQNREVNGIVAGLLDRALVTLFGTGVKAHATKDVRRPGVLGAGTLELSSDYHLSCNLAPTTASRVVRDAWDIWSPL
jgi:hypothetical protein